MALPVLGCRPGAANIQRVVSVARASYPGGEVRLVLPVEPEMFFAEDGSGEAESVIRFQMPESAAERRCR